MNLNQVKNDFIAYIKTEIEPKVDKEYIDIDSDYSIFKYSGEFKEFLQHNLKADASIFSMSINEILDMDIENGKLVDPEEDQTGDTFESETQDSENANALEENEEKSGLFSQDEQGESNPDEVIPELLNKMFEMDEVKSVIDVDSNNELDEGEITNFLQAIAQNDNMNDSVSLEDILIAMKDINNNNFTFDTTQKKIDEHEAQEAKLEPTQTYNNPTSGAYNNGTSSGINGSSSASGAGNSAGASGNYGNNAALKNSRTKEKIKAELDSKKTELDENQKTLDSIKNNTDDSLNNLKEQSEDAYKEYQEKLKEKDEGKAKEVDELKTKIDEEENTISECDITIGENEAKKSEAESTYNSKGTLITSLNNTISALESAKANEKDSSKIAEIDAEIQKINSEIEQAKSEQAQAEEDKNAAIDAINEAKEKKSTTENQLNTDKDNLSKLQDQIAQQYPELTELQNTYKEKEENYEKTRENAITDATNAVKTSQDDVNKLQEEYDRCEEKETNKEHMSVIGGDCAAAVDWARQYDNKSQSEMAAIFSQLGYQFDSGAWCADFVRMSLGEGVGDENLPDWYKNVQNKAYCPSIQAAGEGHQISAEEAQTGDIVLYDWDGDGSADHIGLLVDNGNGSSTITAIEGNTSGAGGSSCVEEKSRNRSNILGIYSMN